MSITDFVNKIKGQMGIDGANILLILIIMLVGIGSFGLGRLSIVNDPNKNISILDNENVSSVKEEIGNSFVSKDKMDSPDALPSQKMYVASKNGKLYYRVSCSGASRIKPENKMWFSSKEEAEDSGFTLASSCE